jgi:hypothetical protein
VVHSRNNSCCAKARVQSVGVVELYVTVSIVKISSVAQQCFHGEFMWPSTYKVRIPSCNVPDVAMRLKNFILLTAVLRSTIWLNR